MRYDAYFGYDWSICCWLAPETILAGHVSFLRSCGGFIKSGVGAGDEGLMYRRVAIRPVLWVIAVLDVFGYQEKGEPPRGGKG